ncbi:hypothetical protein BO78DRAFT_343224 [Aspergillus sclerotiicarbonarius CBS 121057]|uniref:Pre-rRNA processing protein n=1 Tax=Aspergillus sclerotiicarbonarius (strain CBS 121057 / IBT 28362) TaxID=1448318 RepID=A0A319E924_ASPSB|nr:hypothetical protein BO78DRAFT_343224 [Aspergillus sclerotiicarbonarius CBS 121057]
MAEEENRPLLDEEPQVPSTCRSSISIGKAAYRSDQEPHPYELSSESTPLLVHRDDDLLGYGGAAPRRPSSEQPRDFSPDGTLKKRRGSIRWPVFCALLSVAAVVVILVFAFIAPAAVKEYAKEAMVFTPTNVSIESANAEGLQARVQGELVLDARRIEKWPVRNIGRFVTWIGREVETGQSEVEVMLPEYGNVLVGTASLPAIRVNVQSGHVNHVDFLAELVPGELQGIRSVALDWLDGRLKHLTVTGRTIVDLKSGLLTLGQQLFSDSMTFTEGDFPALPTVNITNFNVHDPEDAGQQGAMAVDASVAVQFDSPFSLNIPPLGFEILVPNCSPGDPQLLVAAATTQEFPVTPGQPTLVDVAGIVRGLSDDLTRACPGKKSSPLDFLVKSYMQGLGTTVYVRGADAPSLATPDWVVDILKSVTVPLSFTGRALDNLVRNFTMSDVHFSMPDPFADPDSPESQPTVSALVKVLIGLPKELGLQLDVPRVRATADVFHRGSKLGILDLHKWQSANSTLLDDVDGSPALFVDFGIKNAPLEVTDEDVLTDVLQELIFQGKRIKLDVAASVDAEVTTGLGTFTVREIPAQGEVVVKPPYGGSLDQLSPHIESVELGTTTASSLLVNARVNATNPSPYSASVPFVDFLLLFNGSKVAHITAKDVTIVPGVNDGIPVDLLWSPLALDGSTGVTAGRELLSNYISGYNTTVTIQTHEGTIPGLPKLGKALSRLGLEVQIPRVPVPRAPGTGNDPDDGSTGFIQGATMHLWSSTAEFTLSSPFPNTTIHITSVYAQAYYEGDEEVGTIDYRVPFAVPPGISVTPRLPVDLNLGGIGYDALKKALGGTLALDAVAQVGVQIQHYRDIVFYHGKGITARVKL